METTAIFQRLGISLLLGLLVGMQRERAEAGMPGLRTFPLITVLGSVAALIAAEFGGWVLGAALVGLIAMLVFPNLVRLREPQPDPGITTDVAVLVMYGVGALVMLPEMVPVAVVVGGGVAVLLQFKLEMHRFVERLGDADLRAIMQFVLITCIILPVLPNEAYGPYGVFNPFKTWLLVALIVGMSLGGYIAYKFLGQSAGVLLGGVLGGVISSTATTVSSARQARAQPDRVRAAAVVILIASTVVFVRVLVEIGLVAPSLLAEAAPPLLALMMLTFLPAAALWHTLPRGDGAMPAQKNPTQFRPAIVFAAMYVVILFALAAGKEYLGDDALYPVAILSGLTDMDAITLSAAEMAHTGAIEGSTAWRLVVSAALANLVFKAGLVAVLGTRELAWLVVRLFAVPLIGGVGLIMLWPA